MKKYATLVAVMLLFTIESVSAADFTGRTKVLRLHIDRNLPNKVFVDIESAVSGRPVCHTNSWDYVLPLNEEWDIQMLESLRQAQRSGSSVNTLGADDCNIHGNVQTLRAVTLDNRELLTGATNRGRGDGLISSIQPYFKDRILFKTTHQDAPTSGYIATSECVTNQKGWTLDLSTESGRAMFSTVLTAYAQGKSVVVNGRGYCLHTADRESLYSVRIEG